MSLAALLIAFLLALFYLSQTIHVAATNYDVVRLDGEHEALRQQLSSLQGQISARGSEPVVVNSAQEAGLARLGGPVRLGER